MSIHSICKTCGVQFSGTQIPPERCPICEDQRQYIGTNGQEWTTLKALQQDHHNVIKTIEPGLTGIATHPEFAIGQRAMLVQTPHGNILWDCISLIDEPTKAAINALGGIAAIASSHPHFYASMVEWSRAFNAPIYLHEDNRKYVMRPDLNIHYWQGETLSLLNGPTLVRCGGHFKGSSVLFWPEGADGRGVLLTGDTITVVPDSRFVSFMYSYPNLIPLPARAVQQIAVSVEPYSFDRIYGGWWGRVIPDHAKQVVAQSADRYVAALNGEGIEIL